MANKSNNAKEADRASYSQLMGLEPTRVLVRVIPWLHGAKKTNFAAGDLPMQVGESRSGIHNGTPFTIRRMR